MTTPELPEIKIIWDPDKQEVSVQFKTDEFKTWDFVDCVLGMAKLKCQQTAKIAQIQNLQQAAMMAQRDQQLAQKILRG